MGLKNELSIAEKATIEILLEEKYSARAIATRLGNGRSHNTVSYHLNLLQRDRQVRVGKKRKLSARDDMHIGMLASKR
jgi:IS30 family transposase